MDATTPLYELASSYWKSSSLQAALDLGIFEALVTGPFSVEHLAEQLACDKKSLTALLDALVGLHLLVKDHEEYSIAPDMAPFLNPGSDDSLLGAFSFNRDLQSLWNGLADSVRSGSPVLPASPHLGADPERTKRFVMGMHSRAALMARGLLEVVTPPDGTRILDLAGGPGTFSLRLVQRNPSLKITVFDLPPVVQAARDIHHENPSASEIQFVGGDYHKDILPGDQDMVLYCGAAHQELPDQVPDILSCIRSALKPGGTVILVDLLLDDDRTTPVYAALFDLNMRLMRPTSHVHTVSGIQTKLSEAGFYLVRTGDVPDTPYRYIQATLNTPTL